MSMISRFFSRVIGWIKPLFKLVVANVKREALDFINDPENQAMAAAAVRAAIDAGLHGGDAWKLASEQFKAQLIASGKEAAQNVIDSTLQLAVTIIKNAKD